MDVIRGGDSIWERLRRGLLAMSHLSISRLRIINFTYFGTGPDCLALAFSVGGTAWGSDLGNLQQN
jgi:hypothetical protein